jgi:hypothetical protein
VDSGPTQAQSFPKSKPGGMICWLIEGWNKYMERKAISRLAGRKGRLRPFLPVRIKSPSYLCLYRKDYSVDTLRFFEELERTVLLDGKYVELDFSDLIAITAAASLVLFAKISRSQCCMLKSAFKYADFVVTYIPPTNKEVRALMSDSGLFVAMGPGGQPKLDRLWADWSSPFKTSNDPSGDMSELVAQLLKQAEGLLPQKIIAAVQEGYLNIAHHAYEEFKNPQDPLHPFMVNRFWQYARFNKDTGKLSVALYDLGSGIPQTIKVEGSMLSDCDAIMHAMKSGVTRFKVRGRGRGFNDIKSPIDRNESAEYLLVYSGRGQVIYRKGVAPIVKQHGHVIGGTLLEWTFAGVKK